MSRSGARPLKLLIVGLDGGTWTVIEPLIKAGRLPHMARIVHDGCRGDLASTVPPVTPPAWTSFMTGMNPGKHGLYNFVEPEPGRYRMRYTNARSRKARTLWSLLSEAGRTVGVINVPMTYPPEPVNGFMISGMDTPGEASEFIYPPRIAQELRRVIGPVKLDLRYLGFMNTDARRQSVLDELREVDEQRLRMVLHLLDHEPVEILMVVYGSPDTCQHYFWHYMDPAHARFDPRGSALFGGAIAGVYERLDRHLGVLVERLAQDGVVMLVSDHGFGPVPARTVYLNRYLAQLGVLHYRRPPRGARLLARLARAGDALLRGTLTSDRKRWLARLFPSIRGKWESSLTGFDAIDWARTRAYCSEILAFPADVWVNLRGRQPAGIVERGPEYEDLVAFLRERLLDLRDPVTGVPVIGRVHRKEEVYEGPYLDRAPDLLLGWWEGDGFAARASLPEHTGSPVVVESRAGAPGRSEWTGNHREDGLLAVCGGGIRQHPGLPRSRIVDLAPTILYLMGAPVPEGMDGRVLTELLDEWRLAREPVRRGQASEAPRTEGDGTYSADEAELIEKRLRDLGYVE